MNHLDDKRPDPDELLESLESEEIKKKRGKLKIFFGMCAGVGKTYSMLLAARADKLKGIDIIIGYVDTHNREETERLLEGFEIIPRKTYEYKSTLVQDMDLDAILARKPQLVLIDELAHTNISGCRHTKRYQDVQEVLENGIDVYTTLNVQHLESRSETVAQITGIVVHETLPDLIFENTDEIELVDITPEELQQRLSEGKVYSPERSKEAMENFFRKGNVTAMREMALRIVADRVDKQLHDYMQQEHIRGPWKSGQHLLVAVDYNQQSTRLLRWAKNLSYSMGANIQALYVETLHKLSPKESEQLYKNLSLAKQLGIKTRIITNSDVVKAIIDFANKENVTHIIVGKPRIRNISTMFQLGNFVNRLIRYSGNIDIYVLGADRNAKDRFKTKLSIPSFSSDFYQYVITSLLVISVSGICYSVRDLISYQVVSFVLLFLVSILALFYGVGPILVATTLSAAIWDYLFIEPQFTLNISRPVDVMTLTMFFIIALLNGILTSRVRLQEKKIRVREERTHALYQLARDLSVLSGMEAVSKNVVQYINKYFNLNCAILLKNESDQFDYQIKHETGLKFSGNDLTIANWVYNNSAKAGKFTNTLPSTRYTFYPLTGNTNNMGVIAIEHTKIFTHGEEEFWDAVLPQISGKFEREFLRNITKKADILKESDKLYETLFNSISHELRIPVAAIMGASDSLLTQSYPEETRLKLYSEINTASIRLNRLIENLLNMSRLESGRISPRMNWCDVHDLANEVSDNLKQELTPFTFTTVIPKNMPLVLIDFGLIEQVIHNLVLNATQYAQTGTRVRLKFFYDAKTLIIQVMDRGPGFQKSDPEVIFSKFYRGKGVKTGGTGLGLSIVKGFVKAHGGTVIAENRKNGGAVFTIKIPVEISEIKQFDKQV
ncbi:MAG: sensor histidine kinase KdpD [Bacteroidales bacterium]